MGFTLRKFKAIVSGWTNYVFENEEVEKIATERAKICGRCDEAKTGLISSLIGDKIEDIEGLVCGLCDCPLSGLTRSMGSECKANKWQSRGQMK